MLVVQLCLIEKEPERARLDASEGHAYTQRRAHVFGRSAMANSGHVGGTCAPVWNALAAKVCKGYSRVWVCNMLYQYKIENTK